jgi:hypothetical protein
MLKNKNKSCIAKYIRIVLSQEYIFQEYFVLDICDLFFGYYDAYYFSWYGACNIQ